MSGEVFLEVQAVTDAVMATTAAVATMTPASNHEFGFPVKIENTIASRLNPRATNQFLSRLPCRINRAPNIPTNTRSPSFHPNLSTARSTLALSICLACLINIRLSTWVAAQVESRRLILDRLTGTKETVIYAVDHSASALRSAVEELGGRKEAAIRFVHAEVQNLASSVNEQVDAVIYCNSIHYVNDKVALLNQIRERLRPGGILAFNTSFFEGSHPPESHDFYRRWMMRSLRTLRKDHGLFPDKNADKTGARRQLTPEEYKELLEGRGFRDCPSREPLLLRFRKRVSTI